MVSWDDCWKDFLCDENVNLLDSITKYIDESQQKIRPNKDEVLEIFTLINPKEIRAIIIGQSPYPNDDACGIPFVSANNNVPASLQNIVYEIEIEYGKCNIKDPNDMIRNWILQGVFIINTSPTIGISGKEYLRDHSIIWKEFMIKLLEYITKDTIPVLLFGKDAWSFEENIKSKCILKVPHPVSRGDRKFLGCMVFTDTNKYLKSISSTEITWFS